MSRSVWTSFMWKIQLHHVKWSSCTWWWGRIILSTRQSLPNNQNYKMFLKNSLLKEQNSIETCRSNIEELVDIITFIKWKKIQSCCVIVRTCPDLNWPPLENHTCMAWMFQMLFRCCAVPINSINNHLCLIWKA